ncbi:MAG: hypothetical protein KGQ66_09315 [Acidobacteriota bacterium]|nr:hypothetical protein [Acidobacteriota bacterium]
MSDADDQMGGTGGERGPGPAAGSPPAEAPTTNAPREGRGSTPEEGHPRREGPGEGDGAGEESTEDSFPASDPPGNY